ncbi:MAG: sulfotransferase [Alphaproteobacteria bacterium]|nr:sulfotransferase [Alphaproteobacteria bacterium]
MRRVRFTDPYARDDAPVRPPGPPSPALLDLPVVDPPCDPPAFAPKDIPARDLDPDEAEALDWVRWIGEVDVAPIAAHLRALGPGWWSAETQGRINVRLERPAHDAWGVRSALFVFSDDFLERVLELPLWTDPTWRRLLAPVFAAAGARPERVVRCLLARLAPNHRIPAHHDSGPWVERTRRFHLAIRTDERVVFGVGVRSSRMRRVRFAEGALIELNNAATHAVDNLSDVDRVHLIFDVLDRGAPPPRLRCEPGEPVVQTRRSVDRARDAGRRPWPSWIILGAQKCGTTSLFNYLHQHPLSCRGRLRETHFFDWRWPRAGSDAERLERYRALFDAERLHRHPSLLTGESTPSYLLLGHRVIPRIRRLRPDARLIIALRDPVERAWSQYRMTVDPEGTDRQRALRGAAGWGQRSFAELVDEAAQELEAAGVTPRTPPAAFLALWDARVGDIHHGGHSLLARGLYALQLQPWLAAFPGQVHVVRIEDFATPEGARRQMEALYAHVGLPPIRLPDPTPRNTRPSPPMPPEVEARLQDLYAPYNQRLEAMTGISWVR